MYRKLLSEIMDCGRRILRYERVLGMKRVVEKELKD